MRETSEAVAIRLPKIDVPTFTGDIRDWNDFADLFRNLVHDNANLSGVQKLYYLKMATKGASTDIIKDFAITDANYLEAWNCMNQRYDNKRATIKAHLNDLFALQRIKSEKELRKLLDDSAKSLRSLKALGENVDGWSTIITYWLSTRLDDKTAREWEISLSDFSKFPTLKQLKSFLNTRAAAVEESPPPISTAKKSEVKNAEPKTSSKSTMLNTIRPKCYTCSGNHYLLECDEFKKKSPEARYEVVKAHNLCVVCFCKKHSTRDCKAPRCKKCSKPHNTMLHRENRTTETPSESASNSEPSGGEEKKVNIHVNKSTANVILPTAIVEVELVHRKVNKFTRVILDSCSQANLVTESLVKRLKLPIFKSDSIISCIAENTITSEFSCALTIHSRFSNDSLKVLADVVPYIPYVSQINDLVEIQHKFQLQKPAEFSFLNGKVELLVGAEHYEHCMRDNRHFHGELAVRDTIFGDVVIGRYPNQLDLKIPSTSQCLLTIDDQLRKFWEIEEIDVYNPITDEESACSAHFEATHARDDDGRFIVRLPFKENHGKLSKLYLRAVHSLERLERKCPTDLKKKVVQFMNEYENLGHMTETKLQLDDSKYFIPYQVVERPTSTTTKVRVVFNASAKSKDDLSLNDALLKGPQLQPDLMTTLIGFRKHKIAFTADIAMMYRQVKVHEEDAKFQRILWRNSADEAIREYQLTTVTYGTTPASFLATKCLAVLSEEAEPSYPQAAHAISQNFYMDDLMTGADDLDSATSLQKQIHNILQRGCFPLRKYVSNSAELLNQIDPELVLKTDSVDIGTGEQCLVLGLIWAPEADTFQIRLKLPELPAVVTKRSMLSEISRIFDPLGFFAPATIKGKLLLQKLWRYQLTWDEPVSDDVKSTYLKFRDQLGDISEISVKRRYCDHSNHCVPLRLCGFSDASEKAYSAVVYTQCSDGNVIQSYIICAKTRVAPIRECTIPRLELTGALLLAELLEKISKTLRVTKENVFCLTDSTIVLCWLRKPISDLKTFVANRVTKILKLFPASHWHHVTSEENPSDLATRGTRAKCCHSEFWLQGPDWLSTDFVATLKNRDTASNVNVNEPFTSDKLPETKKKKTVCMLIDQSHHNMLELLDLYSDFRKLLNVVAYMSRFSNNCRLAERRSLCDTKRLSVAETNEALLVIVRLIQGVFYSKELSALKKKGHVTRKSNIFTFHPFVDDKNVLRVGGRLGNSNFSFDKNHPILLPANCTFTKLYLRHVHERYFHASPSFLITFVNQKFRFVSGLKNVVKKICHDCAICVRHSKKTMRQLMGQLPTDRVTVTRPFAITGTDFAGPFILKPVGHRSKARFKGYIAVFVCYTVRAVHLEAVSDLTSAAFLAALKRFCARRVCPNTMYTDNAKNFVGAANLMTDGALRTYTADQGMDWHFNPPRAPHFGGIFEAVVRVMKAHLKRTIGNQTLTFEELGTLAAEIESVMNSRPLYAQDDDHESYISYITPGHFLTGTHVLQPPNADDPELPLPVRWRLLNTLKASFWKRWRNDYLNTFQKQNKWHDERPDLKVKDLVFIKDDTLKPNRYNMGRVTRIFPGHDGRVRVAELKTATGSVVRPIVKLIRLPHPGEYVQKAQLEK